MSIVPVGVIEDNFRFQILVGGVDVTFFRNIATPLPSWESAEPFDDSQMTISFPQITPFEARPDWLYAFAPVLVNMIHSNNSATILWEGLVASVVNHLDANTFYREVACIGALYQLDLSVAKPPVVSFSARDLGTMISDEFNNRPGLKTARCNVPICGIQSLVQPSPSTPLLTSYIQQLLAKATVSISPGRDATVVGIADCPTGSGYWLCATDGAVIAFGERTPFFGTMANQPLNKPISSMASDPLGRGYWLVAEDGGVFAFGEVFAGSAEEIPGASTRTFVDIEATPSGNGYWVLDDDAEIYAFGDANYLGGSPSLSGHKAVSMARTTSGLGYLILDDHGGVYAYGDAEFLDSGILTGKTFVAIDTNKRAAGYWLLTNDGTVYGYGASTSLGPALGAYNLPPCDLVVTSTDLGYHVAAEDGGVFSYGDAVFRGSVPGGGGVPHQWTLLKNNGRVPVIKVKDTWTEHWHVTVGTPGVTFDFTEDFTTMPNVIYGEGLDPNGCFPEGTPVVADDIEAVSRRPWTKGLVHVLTANGRHLACTPNHPVLTPNGWVAAIELHPGSQVVQDSRGDESPTSKPHEVDSPASIDEVFRSALKTGVSEWRSPTGMDFHGDVSNGDVEVVWTNGQLGRDIKSGTPEQISEFPLSTTNDTEVGLTAYCHACSLLRSMQATSGLVSVGSHGPASLDAHLPLSQHQTLLELADRDSMLIQDGSNGVVRDSNGFGDEVSGLPAEVLVDDVLFVYFDSSWSGDVYNLHTKKGWYYANNIAVHNCFWRNTKYPNTLSDATPVWPGGGPYRVGNTGAAIRTWKQRMSDLNYHVDMSNENISTYTERDRKECVALQTAAGIAITGTINAQTWVATFNPGENSTSLFSVDYAPLVKDPKVDQYLYTADGSVYGTNPDWNPNIVRVERWENFGANVLKDEGFRAAEAELARANFAQMNGTITLLTDPEEGSRYLMKAGQNIVIRALAGLITAYAPPPVVPIEPDEPPPDPTLPPGAPVNLDYFVTGSGTSQFIHLTWNAFANTNSFYVWRDGTTEAYKVAHILGASSTGWSDPTPLGPSSHVYYVAGENSAGIGPKASVVVILSEGTVVTPGTAEFTVFRYGASLANAETVIGPPGNFGA